VASQGTLSSNNYSFTFTNGTLTVYLSGLIGRNSLSLGANSAVADSFDSTGGYPATQGSSVQILSNGAIDIGGAKISGNIVSTQATVNLQPGTIVNGNVGAGGTITTKGT